MEQASYQDDFAFPSDQALQGMATHRRAPTPISTSPYVSAYSPPATVHLSAIENGGTITGDGDPYVIIFSLSSNWITYLNANKIRPQLVSVTESGYFSPIQALNTPPRTLATQSIPSSHDNSPKAIFDPPS